MLGIEPMCGIQVLYCWITFSALKPFYVTDCDESILFRPMSVKCLLLCDNKSQTSELETNINDLFLFLDDFAYFFFWAYSLF